jgi:putative ABC transport system substrate-binding protein
MAQRESFLIGFLASLTAAAMLSPPVLAADTIIGQVLGAGAPIVGSTVTLWAENAGQAPRQLAQTQSGSDGRFAMVADGNGANLYLVATGGRPTANATSGDIPIVFMFVSDPIGSRIVGDLAHPGGSVTGFTAFEPSMGGKWLQILRELVPSVRRIGLLFNPTTAPNAQLFIREMEPIASSMSIELGRIPVHDVSEMEVALRTFASAEYGALVVVPDIFTTANRTRLIAVVAELRLPTIYSYPLFVTDGGLVSYGIPSQVQYMQAAAYVDRILRGTHPGELPVQQPTKFELTINVKTAKALGLTIPPMLLTSVDEIIE